MKRLSLRASLLAATLALVAATGLIGGVLSVHPAVTGLKYSGQAVAFNEAAGTYLVVATVPTGVPGPGAFVLRASVVNATTGTTTAPTDCVASSTPINEPAIAWNASRNRYLAVYSGSDAGSMKQVFGVLLDPEGRPDAGAGFVISAERESDSRRTKVASDGTDWLVVWNGTIHRVEPNVEYEQWGLVGRRVGGGSVAAGPDLGSSPFEVTSNDDATYGGIEVVYGSGPQYMVAWDLGQGSLTSAVAIEGRTVSPEGVLGETRRYATDPMLQDGLALTPGPTGFLLGWGGRGTSLPQSYAFMVQPLDGSGAPVGSTVIIWDAVATREGWYARLDRKSLSLTWNAPSGRFFAAWAELPASDPGTWWTTSQTPYSGATTSRLMGTTLDGNTLHVKETAFPLLGQDLPFASGALLRAASNSAFDSRVLFSWRDGGVNARIYDIAGVAAPLAPSAGQYRMDGTTPLPAGAVVTQPTFVVRAPVSDANGNTVRLEVQVAETGSSLSTAGIQTGEFVASGSVAQASVTLPAFALGKTYHWRVRAVDVTGVPSRWVPFHSDPDDANEIDLQVRAFNALPAISGLEQSRDFGAMEPGSRISPQRQITFRAASTDGDNDEIHLEVELRRVGQAFTGVATNVGPWTAAGGTILVAVPFPGADAGEAYRWRARSVDSLFGASDWVSFGSNDDEAADFEFLARGSVNTASCLGSAAALPVLPLLIAILGIAALKRS